MQDIEQRYEIRVDIVPDKGQMPGHADFTFETNPNAAVTPDPEPDFGPPQLPDGYELTPDEDDIVTDPSDLEPVLLSEESERQLSLLDQRKEAKERKRRRRERDDGRDSDRGSRRRESPSADAESAELDSSARDWDMPSFEMVDLEEFQKRDSSKRRERGGRSRRGRGGSGGGGGGRESNVVSAHEILAGLSSTPAPAPTESGDAPAQSETAHDAKSERPRRERGRGSRGGRGRGGTKRGKAADAGAEGAAGAEGGDSPRKARSEESSDSAMSGDDDASNKKKRSFLSRLFGKKAEDAGQTEG